MYVDDADMEQSKAQNALPVGEGPSDPQTFSKDSKAYQIDCRTQAAVIQALFNACITPEVIEVSCSCMLAQLCEAEEKNESSIAKEHAVLAEFARCLDHILESVDKLRNLQKSAAECGTLSESAVHPLVPMVRPPQSLPIVPVEHLGCDYIYADPGQACATATGDSFMMEPQLLEFSYKSDPAISDELIYNGNAFTVNEDVVAETPQICMQPGEFDEKCFGIVGPDGQVCSMPFCYDDVSVVILLRVVILLSQHTPKLRLGLMILNLFK
ncbi:unnamed protein product [Dibothriocephalus latus]|uniref:Uncharacterized protein n=1 Tax=Dibothriocephalus latus TaxID=60516 RepID=A0A3P7M1Y1_DIBLA|nr:unnamed protein product [Dibothriocephalus latus]